MRALLFIGLLAILACGGEQATVERITKVYSNGNPERVVVYDATETIVVGEKYYYNDGNIRIEGPMKDNERHGEWLAYTFAGTLQSVNNYVNGEYHGPYFNYFPNGELRIQGEYADGKEIGEWIVFNQEGKRDGVYRKFHPNGQLNILGKYADGEEEGTWKFFNERGEITLAKDF